MNKVPIKEIDQTEKRKIIRRILEKRGVDCTDTSELEKLVVLLDILEYIKSQIESSNKYKEIVKNEI